MRRGKKIKKETKIEKGTEIKKETQINVPKTEMSP